MRDLDPVDGDEDDGTVFRDLVMLTLLGFVTMVILMLPHLAPPTQGREAIAAPGNLIVEARWPDGVDVDVDLWVRAPGDDAVGYSRSNGRVFDLLRDDLGFDRDDTGLNYEFAFSRGAPAGAYVVNIHLYSNRVLAEMVPVTVHISLSPSPDTAPVSVADRRLTLRHAGHELTVARFSIDDHGRLIPGSVNDFPISLKSARSG
ncbi:MAG TPA: hypothetical protein VIR38_00130 [Thalassobaculum sp.]